ncbi:hypothetical protein [Niallia sp. Krafla_26]|uniref:hypothetical protein n=1 Tax=Niallia sp. Krafla_26 TaxID=3064703 RepID=UPI003D170A42
MHVLKQVETDTVYYLSVESHYFDIKDAKGEDDAVIFSIGKLNERIEIDAVITASVEGSRAFANAILKLCDEIENGGESE